MLKVDFSEAPTEPIARLIWLSGVKEAVRMQLESEWRQVYFQARQQGILPIALDLRYHSRKKVLAYTRAENESRGRVIARWGDGL